MSEENADKSLLLPHTILAVGSLAYYAFRYFRNNPPSLYTEINGSSHQSSLSNKYSVSLWIFCIWSSFAHLVILLSPLILSNAKSSYKFSTFLSLLLFLVWIVHGIHAPTDFPTKTFPVCVHSIANIVIFTWDTFWGSLHTFETYQGVAWFVYHVLSFPIPYLVAFNCYTHWQKYKVRQKTSRILGRANKFSQNVNLESPQKKMYVPFETSSLANRVFYWWIIPLLRYASSNTIKKIPELPVTCEAGYTCHKLFKSFFHYHYSLFCAILRSFSEWLAFGSALFATLILIGFLEPLVIKKLYEALESDQASLFIVAGYYIVQSAIVQLGWVYHDWADINLTMGIRTGLSQLVYEKALKATNADNVLGILSTDVNTVSTGIKDIKNAVLLSLKILLVFSILFYVLGKRFVPCIVMLSVICFAHWKLSMKGYGYSEEYNKCKDQRIELTETVLLNAKAIKINTMEKHFEQKIDKIKEAELQNVRKGYYLEIVTTCLYMNIPYSLLFMYLFMTIMLGYELKGSETFVVMTLFESIKDPVGWLSYCIKSANTTLVSVRKIQDFLLSAESLYRPVQCKHDAEPSIKIRNYGYKRHSGEKAVTVTEFNAAPGEFIGVTGKLGSGKSSILKAIIGQLISIPKDLHSVQEVKGSISYCPQVPWIFNASVKDNVICNVPFDEQKFWEVIEVCGLTEEVKNFDNGIDTIINQNISGGQKARLGLARAVYSGSQIVILDNVLAQLDPIVQKHVLKKCILDALQNKTVIFSTTNLSQLHLATRIYFIENGETTASGTYTELLQTNSSFLQMHQLSLQPTKPVLSPSTVLLTSEQVQSQELPIFHNKINHQLSFTSFLGCTTCFLTILLLFANNVLARCLDLSVGRSLDSNSSSPLFIIFSFLAYFLVSVLTPTIYSNLYSSSSQKLHEQMLHSVLRAPYDGFFNTVSMGNILARFSVDLNVVEMDLMGNFYGTISSAASAITSLAFCVYVLPAFSLMVPIFVGICYVFQKFVLPATAQLVQLMLEKKGQILQHTSDTLQGIDVIRSCGYEVYMRKKSLKAINETCKPYFYKECSQYFYSIYNKFANLVALAGLLGLLSIYKEDVSGNFAVLAVLCLGTMTDTVFWFFFGLGEFQSNITAFKRCAEYSAIQTEDSCGLEKDNEIIGEEAIEVKDLTISYKCRPEVPVLKNINFTINPGEKVGIIGRTGCGKTTLLMSLLRLVEPRSGYIRLGLNALNSIKISQVRKCMGVIPQDVFIFEGTLRENLDPYGECDATQMEAVLEKLGLNLPLTAMLQKAGRNLSLGERQLVALARVLLKNVPIVVFDEATASLDSLATQKINEIVKKELKDKTMIIISHKIETVLGLDKVMILEQGEIIEYGAPKVLLEIPGSTLNKYVHECDN